MFDLYTSEGNIFGDVKFYSIINHGSYGCMFFATVTGDKIKVNVDLPENFKAKEMQRFLELLRRQTFITEEDIQLTLNMASEE